MKKIVFVLVGIVAACAAAGQTPSRFCISTSLGTGIALTRPASTPVVWRVEGYYNVSRRFSVGAGTGLAFYERPLIPLCVQVRFLLTRPRRFTPFAEWGAGYAFAPQRDAEGGFRMAPAIGVQYALKGGAALFLSAGWELQNMARLKTWSGERFSVGFREKLRHRSIALSVGVRF